MLFIKTLKIRVDLNYFTRSIINMHHNNLCFLQMKILIFTGKGR